MAILEKQIQIEDYGIEDTILEMKLKLEHMKKALGKVPKEQADKNIAAIRKEKEDNAEFRQDEENDLNVISSKHVDTYTYSTDDLVQAY